MRHFVPFMSCLLLAGNLGLSLAASTSIGTVLAPGGFQVDHARVSDSATLFDGTLVQTGKAAGDLRLTVGAKAQLASESRARVFRDRLVLEQGIGQLYGSGYRIEARTLQIAADEPNSSARVALQGSTHVLVAALRGHLRVTNARGIVVANLAPGAALTFEPQGASPTASQVTGIVRKHGNKFFLTDETTNVTVELRGFALQDKVGQRVEISGNVDADAVPTKPATQVIAVRHATVAGAAAGAAGAAGVAGAAGAGGAAAAGTATGISLTTIAIVGGVAAAGTVAGLGLADALPGQGEDSTPTSSR